MMTGRRILQNAIDWTLQKSGWTTGVGVVLLLKRYRMALEDIRDNYAADPEWFRWMARNALSDPHEERR